MKKVLVVGFTEYDVNNKLAEKYSDVVWLFAETIRNIDKPEVVATVTGMIDAVMFGKFVSDKERLVWEVACCMMKKQVLKMTDFPLDDDKGEENAETL